MDEHKSTMRNMTNAMDTREALDACEPMMDPSHTGGLAWSVGTMTLGDDTVRTGFRWECATCHLEVFEDNGVMDGNAVHLPCDKDTGRVVRASAEALFRTGKPWGTPVGDAELEEALAFIDQFDKASEIGRNSLDG